MLSDRSHAHLGMLRSIERWLFAICPMFAPIYSAPSHPIANLRHYLASFNLLSLGCQAVMQATFAWAAALPVLLPGYHNPLDRSLCG